MASEKKGVQIHIGMFADWFLGLISGSLSFTKCAFCIPLLEPRLRKTFYQLKTTQCTVGQKVKNILGDSNLGPVDI